MSKKTGKQESVKAGNKSGGTRFSLRSSRSERGVILAAILVVTVLSAMIAAGVLFRIHAESSASVASSNGEQAYQSAMSGLQTVIALFSPPADAEGETIEGVAIPVMTFANPIVLADPTKWYDNPALFKNRLVSEDGANRWYYSIYSASMIDRDTIRYGLTDEAGKVNINTADEATLLRLPGMTPQLVAALLDWRDKDSDIRTDGAEQEYYDQLPVPYNVRNGPLQTIEELLMVKGFTGSIVYGEDANLNTLLEPNEDDADESFPPDNNDGVLDMGLFGAATTASYGPDAKSDGTTKTDINSSAARAKVSEVGLSPQLSTFLQQVRADGGRIKHPSQLLEMTYTITRDSSGGRGGRGGPFTPPPFGSNGPRKGDKIQSRVTAEDMPLIMENFTTAGGSGRAPVLGMVNVNTATAASLAAVPGIDSGTAQQIVEARVNLSSEDRSNTAWLLTQNILDEESYKSAAPKLCVNGYQYRLRIIGFGVPCGRYRIFEVVIDIAGPQPKVLYQRDITRLGLPFPLDVEAEEL